MHSRTSLTNTTQTIRRSWTVDSGHLRFSIIMHLLYHCIKHFDYFIFLYADIYLISSARNKDIMLSPIKLFSSFALTPTQTGKTDDYIHEGDINIHIACISIFNSKGSFEQQHEHKSIVSGLIWTFLRERRRLKISMEPSVMSVSG